MKSKTAPKPDRRTYFEVIPVAMVARLPGVSRASRTAEPARTLKKRTPRNATKP